jgi:Domain of unknown function (DUF4160)
MPTIFRENGYRFFFYSNEGDPREPPHIHVQKGGGEAKVWLEPYVDLEESQGFNASELRAILSIVDNNRNQFSEAWYEHFS